MKDKSIYIHILQNSLTQLKKLASILQQLKSSIPHAANAINSSFGNAAKKNQVLCIPVVILLGDAPRTSNVPTGCTHDGDDTIETQGGTYLVVP